MWCVADLNETTSPRWKTCWRLYERPYDPQQPVVCLDEKPVTLHADVRPDSGSAAGTRGATG